MYLPSFKFLAQFGRELCEEQTQKIRKIRKPNKKPLLSSLVGGGGGGGGGMGLKSRDQPKSHGGPLLNVHIKFQLPSSGGRGEIGKELHFFKVKKGEIPISPLLIDLIF